MIENLICDMPWLPWLLSGLLGLLAGYLIWAKWKKMYADMESKVKGLNKTISGLEADLAACRKARTETESDLALTKGRYRELETEYKDYKTKSQAKVKDKSSSSSSLAADNSDDGDSSSKSSDSGSNSGPSGSFSSSGNSGGTDSPAGNTGGGNDLSNLASGFAAGAATGGSTSDGSSSGNSGGGADYDNSSSVYAGIKIDNLQIVEGIGPKMESILKENGVNTHAELGNNSTSDIQAILNKYGDKYKIIDPETWSQQASLAASKDWVGLIDLQKRLDTGRTNAVGMTDSKLEKVLIKMGAIRRFKQDDLKAVEGIGPAIEKLLHAADIKTWRSLANTSVERLQGILNDAGSRFKLADPGTWPKQSEYAADGKFKELQEYQDLLQGGK